MPTDSSIQWLHSEHMPNKVLRSGEMGWRCKGVIVKDVGQGTCWKFKTVGNTFNLRALVAVVLLYYCGSVLEYPPSSMLSYVSENPRELISQSLRLGCSANICFCFIKTSAGLSRITLKLWKSCKAGKIYILHICMDLRNSNKRLKI